MLAARDMLANEIYRVELKKTKYKKLSAFLESMQEQSVIAMKDVSAGVTQIVSVNRGHPL